MSDTTDFGYERVPAGDKSRLVGRVFSSVAPNYDLMNDLMSAGLHRLWKRFAVGLSGVREGSRVLDVASGSGDLALHFARLAGASGQVYATDINAAMLERGRDRLLDEGVVIPAVLADGERLPFRADWFDCVSIAFGLRNMTSKERALAEMRRVLRPGGRLLVLEFSRVWKPLAALYDAYSFRALPVLGRLVANDPDSYRYLAESIRVHPAQDQLKRMIEAAGFVNVDYFNLTAGVVALHRGYKV